MAVIRRQGIKNAIYAYFGIILGVISTLYVQPYFLSKEEVGLTRLSISLATIFATISNFGTTTIIIKFLPVFHNPAKKHNGFFTISMIFPLVGFFICTLLLLPFKTNIVQFYGANGYILEKYLYPILLMAFCNNLIFSFNAYCGAINKSSPGTLINDILLRIGLMACILLLYFKLVDQAGYIYSLLIVIALQMLGLFLIIKKFDHPVIDLNFFRKNPMLPEMVKFGVTSIFIQVTGIALKFIDVLFIGKFESLKELGVYSIAAFIGLVLEIPLNALEKIAGPKIARLFAHNNLTEIEQIYKLSSRYLFVFCGFLLTILIVNIQPILSILPNDYSGGVWVSIVISIGAFFNSATGVNYSIINYSKYYRSGALFYFFLLFIAVLLNWYLIPIYGIMGAALATAIASVIHNLVRYIFILIKLNMQPFSIDTLKLCLIIPLSMLCGYIIHVDNHLLLIIFRGGVSGLVFATLLITLKVFSFRELKNELAFIKKTFR